MRRQQSWGVMTKYILLMIITSQALASSDRHVNIAKLATLTVSSTNAHGGNDYKKENAVDGEVDAAGNRSTDKCGCCFASKWEDNPSFTARLPGHYHVHHITIVGRHIGGGPPQKLFGIKVRLDNIDTAVVLNNVTNTATVTPASASVQTIHISRPASHSEKWMLVICELQVLASGINIAHLASLEASPVLTYGGHNFSKENAVDGKVGADANKCNCCYCSGNLEDPFFMAYFGQPYSIVDIAIEGRKEKGAAYISKLPGIKVQIDEETVAVNIDTSSNAASVVPSPPLQTITVKRPSSGTPWFLMICELRAYVAECAAGYFGDPCENQCPNCEGACEIFTGHCKDGCIAGFQGDTCDTPCPDGTFGKECRQRCHCKDSRPCNKSTGFCESGCAPGWTGSSCSQACPDGKFGDDCVHSCRCLNNATCDKVLGNCSNGCDYGRSGFDCRTDNNLLSVIKNNVTTLMSSISPGHGPTLAIDGSYDSMSPTFEACDCCSETKGTEKPWWQIDIGRQILIQEMYIIGSQKDVRSQSENLLCDISNTSVVDEAGGTLLENGSHTGTVYHYSYSFPKLFQYLIVRQSSQTVMIVCEVKLIEGDCSNGTFGDGCGRTCHCLDDQPCDKITGRCQSTGCLPGWRGEACDQDCSKGTFGDGCGRTCHCLDDQPCDKIIGRCQSTGCLPGWRGEACDQVCMHGTFGLNCSSHCHCFSNVSCDKEIGTCENYLCMPGWQKQNCSEACDHRTFGMNCSTVCHCLNKTSCDNENGKCVSGKCEAGYKSETCSKECAHGQFGHGCNSRCHCLNDTDCSKANGTCSNGLCEAGWRGTSCSEECAHGTFGFSCNSTCNCLNDIDCWKANGTCSNGICEAGWQGISCSEECDHGTFGHGCISSCHCLNDTDCSKANGTCSNGLCEAGWRGTSCSEECAHGQFGHGCNSRCHCLNDTDCSKANGTCSNGLCEAGWRGTSCSEECAHGTFGISCNSTCNCLNDIDCWKANGTCSNGICEAGWQGISCSEECDHGTFGHGCISSCHCLNDTDCSKANGTCSNGLCEAGWRGTSCSEECAHGTFGISCNSTCNCLNDIDCWKANGTCSNGICETGWKGISCSEECVHGTFGHGCISSCHCLNDTDCSKANGTCSNGLCEAGWRGTSCSEECAHGTFGFSCNSTCNCLNDIDCWKANGTCSNGICEAGWQGISCSEECVHGTFGHGCISSCHCLNDTDCSKANGTCSNGLCEAGWRGTSCSEECAHGTFGFFCNSTCNCLNDIDCWKANGTCSNGMCEAGWKGISCSEGCDKGTFGQNCTQACHCFNRTACNAVHGTCEVGQCDLGFMGASCSQLVQEKPPEDGKPSVAIIAAIIAGVVIVLLVVAAVVCLKRRNKKHSSDNGNIGMLRRDSRSFESLDDCPETERRNQLPDPANNMVNNAFEGETNEYISFTPTEGDVTLAQLWHYIRKHQQNKNQLFYEEFQGSSMIAKLVKLLSESHTAWIRKLPYGLVLPCTEAQKPTNKKRNRYRDMYAYDHSRVVLEFGGSDEADYINACYVNGYEKPKKFIASQGPMDAMVKDFWRMVWQKRVDKIVMLTNPMEAGAVKCIQYWPENGEGEDAYGDIQIKLVGSERFPDYIRRDFTIGMDCSERGVTQFHFKSWPDKDVPDNTWCLVDFWRAVNRDDDTSQDAPIVVHCSAGVGRTGTFIALDFLYNQMKEEGSIRPLEAVRNLRQQRVNMVQTKEQYAFLHEAVADAHGIGTHFVFSSQFPDVHRFLSDREPGSTRTRFAGQFGMVPDILRYHSEPESTPEEETEYANTAASKEIDAYRPSLSKRTTSTNVQEMGAMYLPGYNGANFYLVGKSPSETSLVEFWSLVQEQNVKTVVSLCEPTAKGYKAACTLGADTGTLSSHFAISMITEDKQKAFTERTFWYNEEGKVGRSPDKTEDEADDEYRRMVKVFDFTAWKSGYDTPGDAESMVDFIEAISAWQPVISESQPVLLHCGTGTTRCGVVCLILSELYRLKQKDGQINVLDSLITLKQRNTNIVESEGQYRFCHDVILGYLRYQQRLNEPTMDDENIYINT